MQHEYESCPVNTNVFKNHKEENFYQKKCTKNVLTVSNIPVKNSICLENHWILCNLFVIDSLRKS